eukprot:15480843-Alexandrium_andersonii.AAC.1
MCTAIHVPPIRNPAIRHPANHCRLACVRPEWANTRTGPDQCSAEGERRRVPHPTAAPLAG